MLEGIEPRPEVKQFAQFLELRLRENDWKGGWSGIRLVDLLFCSEEKGRKLHASFERPDLAYQGESIEVVRHAIDQANYDLMFVDNWLKHFTPTLDTLRESLKCRDKPKVN